MNVFIMIFYRTPQTKIKPTILVHFLLGASFKLFQRNQFRPCLHNAGRFTDKSTFWINVWIKTQIKIITVFIITYLLISNLSQRWKPKPRWKQNVGEARIVILGSQFCQNKIYNTNFFNTFSIQVILFLWATLFITQYYKLTRHIMPLLCIQHH